jgi:Reverse transcriptase (RNA-dependent DNA polymerase)
MFTERFNRIRKKNLDKIFEKKRISNIWRHIVKDQLRKLDIKDLYDYYDFNYNIDDRASDLRTDILNGNYQIQQPLIYRIEKKLGICRHLVIPQPLDSLVLQVITESLSPEIINKQPSENSFYSQDKHNVHKPHELDEYGLNFKQLWKKLQKQIYKFNEEKELLIVTDLSNYYDSIDINQLRKVISHYIDDKEVLIDLLFRIIEEVSWKPDYLPYTGRGLPTSNLEGIRLMAHSFLFELDAILKDKTNNSFTRWMDDIVIGVDTKVEAIETISSASDVLKSRGLALNIAKTNVYTAAQGRYHFQIEKNQYLDSIDFAETDKIKLRKTVTELFRNLKNHLKDTKPKYWEKITKRFITAFGRLRSKKLLSIISSMYNEIPGVRPNLLIYLQELGYNKKTSEAVLKIINDLNVYDDISLFQVCELITKWELPDNGESNSFLDSFEDVVVSVSKRRKTPFDFFCILWFQAKYRHPDEIFRFIDRFENIWRTNPFLRRQVIVLMSRLIIFDRGRALKFLRGQIYSGNIHAVALATQIIKFSKIEKLDRKLIPYLFPKSKQKHYPLPKFLILCNVLTSEKIRTDLLINQKIKEYIKDPFYLKWLHSFYNIK